MKSAQHNKVFGAFVKIPWSSPSSFASAGGVSGKASFFEKDYEPHFDDRAFIFSLTHKQKLSAIGSSPTIGHST